MTSQTRYSGSVDLGQYLHIGLRAVLSPTKDLFGAEWYAKRREFAELALERREFHARCEELVLSGQELVKALETPLTPEQEETYRRLQSALRLSINSPEIQDVQRAYAELKAFFDSLR
jgi:hypothetical protein